MSRYLSSNFRHLSELLLETQYLWKPVAFHQSSDDWLNKMPEVANLLLGLSAEQIERFHYEPVLLINMLTQTVPQLTELVRLSELPVAKTTTLSDVNPRFHSGIPGRKWQQIQSLCASINIAEQSVLEYCAGKSHLGFYISHCNQISVTALEWNKKLVEQANLRAQSEKRDLTSYQVDVMDHTCKDFFHPEQHVIALHACGALHERLLSLSIDNHVAELSLVPCCYHKRSRDHYIPYSTIGRQKDIGLNKTDLHTAVMETVTAGKTIVKQRKALQTMRLGFDLLQRDTLASDNFLPLPSMPISFSRLNFEQFCQHWAKEKQLTLPNRIDWPFYLKQAQQRFQDVSAFDLVRAVFRRPIEVWLNMDKAIWLQEHQYEVSLSTFCGRKISPRNILLRASR